MKWLEARLLLLLVLLGERRGRLRVGLWHAVLWYRLLLEGRHLWLGVFCEWICVLSLYASGVVDVVLNSHGAIGHHALPEGVCLLRLQLRWSLHCGVSKWLLNVLWECATGGERLLGWLRAISTKSSACVVGLHRLQLHLRRLSLLRLWLAERIC